MRAPLRVGSCSSSMLVAESTGRLQVLVRSYVLPGYASKTASITATGAQVLVYIQQYLFTDINLNEVVRVRNRGS